MCRILFTSSLGSSAWAGSEVLWFQAASRLAATGRNVAAVLPKQMQTPGTVERLTQAGIELLKTPWDQCRSLGVRLARRRNPQSPTSFAPIVYHARKWRADVVVLSQASCWGTYSEMLALAKLKIPYISISQLNTPFSWPGDKLFDVVGEAFESAHATVFVSQGNLDLFQNQTARTLSNSHVIYNPSSIDVTSTCGSVPTDVFRLLNVARIDPAHKGQDLLLDVLALPKWRDRNVELQIAGGGNHEWMETLIASKGLRNIKLLGHVSDLKQVWEQATFGVFPSRYEGMPLAMIEGMALGRAIVATDVAGHAEWIEEGTNGFLATGTTKQSLDKTFERAWDRQSGADAMGKAARETFSRMVNLEPAETLANLATNAIS
jgi:glycosyltransferase involved in cell wall biosynthesis